MRLLKNSIGLLLGFGALYLIDSWSWKPNWNDRVLDRVNRLVPDGWFVDRFAPFDTYELNLTLAFAAILVVFNIIWSLCASILRKNDEEKMEEIEDGERFRG
ncbi:hypothetical protein [Shouchella patagoniensis]|uniref:hypothetical protein n=1 Tax=Shouchella patagoniensis TaxID=228576 RepID=UPI001115F522|nr:hypothetical protein [Shouchella patagoniensis]